jgi:hypothetical protein
MKGILATVVAAAFVLGSAGAVADAEQFRETITVKGSVKGALGEHHLTFNAPIALPGVSLAAGTYIFDRPATNVLRVMNANRVPYLMVATTEASRTGRSDRYEVVLGPPNADGAPRRIEAWFAPGQTTGQQLMYR